MDRHFPGLSGKVTYKGTLTAQFPPNMHCHP